MTEYTQGLKRALDLVDYFSDEVNVHYVDGLLTDDQKESSLKYLEMVRGSLRQVIEIQKQ